MALRLERAALLVTTEGNGPLVSGCKVGTGLVRTEGPCTGGRKRYGSIRTPPPTLRDRGHGP